MDGDVDNTIGRAYSDPELLQHNEAQLQELRNALRFSVGEFSLIALGCDYHRLRHLVNQDLVQAGLAEVLQLPRQFQNLREIIHQHTAERTPPALVIVGLDYLSKADLQAVLHATNMGRDDFRQQFPFPIAIWMNRRVRQQFLQHAPDSRSFSPAAIAFTLPTGELIHALKVGTQQLFNTILARGGDRELSTTSIRLIGSDALRSELDFAIQDLATQGVTPDPQLQASLDFLQGREAHSRLEMESARDRYERSLAFWEAQANTHPTATAANGLTAADGRALLWLHLGLWWRTYAVVQRATYDASLRQARQYFEQLVAHFRDRDQTPHLARFIHVLAEVLQKQRDWGALETLANEGISLHQEMDDPVRLARDHGFLAEVALIKEDWLTAQSEATQALAILDTAEADLEDGETTDQELAQALTVAKRFQRGWYRFLLGEAQMHLSDPRAAIQELEAAREATNPEVDLTLHLKVLEELIHHYFELGDYWDAFCIKQELRKVEYRYNLRAFIGAGAVQPHRHLGTAKQFDEITEAAVAAEIRASGRLADVEKLTQQLQENSHAIVIVHGPSGVGKSSILTAGLVPLLRRQGSAIAGNPTIPLLVQTYGNWSQILSKALDEALSPWFPKSMVDETAAISPADLMAKLRQGIGKNRAFVLVFDQFEEFFFDKDDPRDRRQFYEFLGQCIDQPFVKVVLALREDYLHHLLEAETVINAASQMQDQDLLSRDQRYPLANFSPAAAADVIRQLTSAAQYNLAPDLIQRLVADLAAETGDVRPIELQVVGAQLQRADINTLDQYAAIGPAPKEKLVQDYLAYVVHDCGPPNENLAWLVLYLLTEEDREQRLYRPLKTREELEYELALLKMPFAVDQLTMVLDILVGSGLVFEVPEEPEDRYQLVHDYLVRYVRNVQTPGLMAELEAAREGERLALLAKQESDEKAAFFLAEKNKALQQRLSLQKRATTITAIGLGIVSVLGMLTYSLARAREHQSLRAEKNEIQTLGMASRGRFVSDQLGGLVLGIKAIKWTSTNPSQLPDDVRFAIAAQFLSLMADAQEKNQLEGNGGSITDITFSPDGQTIICATAAGTIKFWSQNGKSLRTVQAHEDTVFDVSFNPSGTTIASAGKDGTVKLWSRDGKQLNTLRGHFGGVSSVTFSPDGEWIASAGTDGKIILWNRQGEVIKTLNGHESWVGNLSFSPDGEVIASAGGDGMIKLWNRQGVEIKTLTGHKESITTMIFSPDGKFLASADAEGLLKLWSHDGEEIKTFTGHENWVGDLSFSPDSTTLVSGGWDGIVRLWNLNGEEISSLNQGVWVNAVDFSPDGNIIASADLMGAVKLWKQQEVAFEKLEGHETWISSTQFSPDGNTIASASADGTLRLWNKNGEELQTFSGHPNGVWNLSYSPDGQTIAAATGEGLIKLWANDGKEIETLQGHAGIVYGVTYSPDGELLASASHDGNIILWSKNGAKLQVLKEHTGPVRSISFSPDGELLASASEDGKIKLWNKDGDILLTIAGHLDWVLDVSFSPDGQTIASASGDGTVKLWNLRGSELRTLEGHSTWVRTVDFSPRGEAIISASDDGTVKLWNLQGEILHTLQGDGSQMYSASFSPDGDTLASASRMGR